MTEPRIACLLVLAATLLPGAGSDIAQQKTWRVAGVVVNSITGQPLTRVRIGLRPSDPPGTPVFTASDAAGRFSFEAVVAGEFDLTAQRSGFPQQEFGQKTLAESLGSAVITGPGLDMEHLVFRLIPPSAISGRVVDDQGDPVQRAMVELFRSSVQAGKRRVVFHRYAYTDDIGEFRISGLGAGSYYLSVAGQPWYASMETGGALALRPGQRGSTLARNAYPVTYYPDTTDPRAASPVVLKPGQEFVANVEMRTESGVQVTATLRGATENVQVAMSAPGIEGNDIFVRASAAGGPVAIFNGIVQGHYRVFASVNGQADQVGMKDIEVGSSDLDVQLDPEGTPRVMGKVELDGGEADALRGAYVHLYDTEKNRSGALPVLPDGSFTGPVPLGRYSVSIGGVKNLSLQGLTIDGAPVPEAVLDIEAPVPREMKIRATFSSARVQGHVYRDGALISGALVVLAPAIESTNVFDFHAYQTDADGSFDFRAIKPGRYVLIAAEDGTDLEYANPAVLAPLRAKGTAIDLASEETLHERVEVTALKPQTGNRGVSAGP
jgi:hypothetical protein